MARKKRNREGAYDKAFPSRLRSLIDNRQTQQQEIADKLNVTRQMITHYCDGSSSPDWEGLVTLAQYFDVPLDWLMGNERINANRDSDAMTVAAYTGLSLLAVEKLHETSGCSLERLTPKLVNILSMLIEQPYLYELLFTIVQVKEVSKTPTLDLEQEDTIGNTEYNITLADECERHGLFTMDKDMAVDLLKERAKTVFGKMLDAIL